MEAWLDKLVDAEKVLECCDSWPHERVTFRQPRSVRVPFWQCLRRLKRAVAALWYALLCDRHGCLVQVQALRFVTRLQHRTDALSATIAAAVSRRGKDGERAASMCAKHTPRACRCTSTAHTHSQTGVHAYREHTHVHTSTAQTCSLSSQVGTSE